MEPVNLFQNTFFASTGQKEGEQHGRFGRELEII